MGILDIALLLDPVQGDAPTGANLEYDQKFVELCLMAQGIPDRVEISRDPNDANRNIERIVPGKEPDAPAMLNAALALFQRTKDLRIAMHATYAATRIDGMAGFSYGTELISRMLERYWSEVHPRLDADDEPDASMRINILNGLCDPVTLLRAVKNAPLAEEGAIGRFTLSDVYAANDASPHLEGQTAVTLELLRAACMDLDTVVLGERLAACRNALANLTSIASIIYERTSFSPDFEPLKKILQRAISIYSEASQNGAGGVNAESIPIKYKERVESHAVGKIVSRGDAKQLLEQACNYLERAEPSHPSPLLIRRAIRLLDMSFIDIIRELTPDAVCEIERLGGIRN